MDDLDNQDVTIQDVFKYLVQFKTEVSVKLDTKIEDLEKNMDANQEKIKKISRGMRRAI